MHLLFTILILLAALPSAHSVVRMLQDPPEGGAKLHAWGLAAITLLSTALLLMANYNDLLY